MGRVRGEVEKIWRSFKEIILEEGKKVCGKRRISKGISRKGSEC